MVATTTRSGVGGAGELAHRPDIDGLRAFSVGVVLAFHFAAWTMPGGFIGVDVFFVISGYLISGLILNRLRQDRFSLADFYARRFRRILPALLVVVAVTLAISTIILMPSDLREAARSGIYAVLGMSNFYFLGNTGYFDIASEMMPFLHTWSLGVEEQFYLAWPLFLWGLYRVTGGRRAAMAAIVGLVTLASLAANLWVVEISPKHDFYLPFTRAWELGLGALLIFLPRLPSTTVGRALAQVMTLAGALLVIGASVLLKNGLPFPGYYAIPPAVGAALLIYDNGQPSLVRSLFSLRPVEFIGRISYSLYLWHWPVLVLWRHYNNGDAPSGPELLGLVAVSLVLSVLSWRFVEIPVRQAKWRPLSTFASAGIAASAVGLAGAAIVVEDGYPQRLPPAAHALGGLDVMWAWQCRGGVTLPLYNYFNGAREGHYCSFGADWATARQKAVVWGDSTAEHYAALLDDIGRRTGTSFVMINPCPAVVNATYARTYPDLPRYSDNCAALQASMIAWLKAATEVTHVLIAARWGDVAADLAKTRRNRTQATPADPAEWFEAGLKSVLPQLMAPGRSVVVIKDIAVVPGADPAACYLSRIALPRYKACSADMEKLAYEQLTTTQHPSHKAIDRAAAAVPGVIALNPSSRMCRDGRCQTMIGDEFIYRDNIHLRRNLKPETMSELIRLIGFDKVLGPNPSGDRAG